MEGVIGGKGGTGITAPVNEPFVPNEALTQQLSGAVSYNTG